MAGADSGPQTSYLIGGRPSASATPWRAALARDRTFGGTAEIDSTIQSTTRSGTRTADAGRARKVYGRGTGVTRISLGADGTEISCEAGPATLSTATAATVAVDPELSATIGASDW